MVDAIVEVVQVASARIAIDEVRMLTKLYVMREYAMLCYAIDDCNVLEASNLVKELFEMHNEINCVQST